jgi:hypothetical protein
VLKIAEVIDISAYRHPGVSRGPEAHENWIPAFAGMTIKDD